MILIALTDIHGRKSAVSNLAAVLKSADVVLLCGDITHFGHKKEMEDMIRLVRDINPALLAVTGNCDYPESESYLAEENLSLHALSREFQGYNFYGLSGSLPCPGKTPNEYSEEEFEAILDGMVLPSGKSLIMVSHQPPFGTLNDEVSPGVHVGSKVIRNFIEKTRPMVCFTGHIHEGIGIGHIGNTAVVNPGPAGNGGYVWAEISEGVLRDIKILP